MMMMMMMIKNKVHMRVRDFPHAFFPTPGAAAGR
jgi:hypothetical protein